MGRVLENGVSRHVGESTAPGLGPRPGPNMSGFDMRQTDELMRSEAGQEAKGRGTSAEW